MFDEENDIFKLTPAELAKVPFDIVRWQCKIKFCKCYTRLRDYGMDPIYYHKGGITSADGNRSNWINIQREFFICSKHWKRYKNKPPEDVPVKKNAGGGIVWGYDRTGKETILI